MVNSIQNWIWRNTVSKLNFHTQFQLFPHELLPYTRRLTIHKIFRHLIQQYGWEIPGCSFPCVICLKVQFFCKSCLKSGLRAYVQFLSISFRHSLRMGFLKIHGAQCHRSAVFHVFHHLLPITDPIGYWKFVYNTARRPTFHH